MKAKILIVDDSALARRTLRQTLESLGYSVDEASEGSQALERFFLHPPDLVILDLVMTGMYGADVLVKMREMNPKARVIIATADIQSATADQVKSAGAVGLINKPVAREKLATALHTVFQGGELWN
ncbi:MAG TPA: response regulator [Candidatus Didemnitutus sp.]|jgi:two-component system chemotaxis response regulator CheY